MKLRIIPLTASAMACFVAPQGMSQQLTRLSASLGTAGLELSWPATIQKADGSVVRPYFELQRSLDFRLWEPVDERRQAAAPRVRPP